MPNAMTSFRTIDVYPSMRTVVTGRCTHPFIQSKNSTALGAMREYENQTPIAKQPAPMKR